VIFRALLCFLLLVCVSPTLAQETRGPGNRPKRPLICMSDAELEAEAQMRAGIILRAFARNCASRGVDGSILPKWGEFDAANVERLREAVRLREEAYTRNYPDDAYAGQRIVDETLASRGIVHPSIQECGTVAEIVNRLATWEDFVAHARLTQLGQVKQQIKRCKPPGAAGGR
jgi:hypothetical protein